MKITDLDYYVKFIFSCEKENVCYSTTDRSMLKNIEFHETGNSPMDYRIGDVIHFNPDKKPYKITDIRISQLIEDTEVLKYGFDSEDCVGEPQGKVKDYLLTIRVTMQPK
jgi:hypothetical protein